MWLLPLQNIAAYSDYVAYTVGGVVVLALVGYVLLTRGRTGRQDDERAHEKAIANGIDSLPATEQLTVRDGPEDMDVDFNYIATTETKRKWRWRPAQWLRRRPGVPGYPVHAAPIEDADGRTIHIASCNGRLLAHRDAEALEEDARTVVEADLNGDRVPATFSERYAEDIQDGFVDVREAKARVQGDCLTRIQSNMRKNEELPLDELRERLVYDQGFRYPPEVFDRKLRDVLNDDVRLRKDGTLVWQHYG